MEDSMERAIDSRADWQAAVLELIDAAQSRLLILDTDLAESGLESPQGIDCLTAFLQRAARPDAIRVLLRDGDRLAHHSPRLMTLLSRFGHRIDIKCVAEGQTPPDTSFCIADSQLLIRFHHERPRGKHLAPGGQAGAVCEAQFETLWPGAMPGPTGAPLGL